MDIGSIQQVDIDAQMRSAYLDYAMSVIVARALPDGYTLEWATTSPPPPYNFDSLPPIRSERPLFDLKHPDYAGHGVASPSAVMALAHENAPAQVTAAAETTATPPAADAVAMGQQEGPAIDLEDDVAAVAPGGMHT